jgi:hypothetical protein
MDNSTGSAQIKTPGDYAVLFVQSMSAATLDALASPFTTLTDMLGSVFYAAGLY